MSNRTSSPLKSIKELICKWWRNHEASHNFFTGLSSLLTILAIIGGGVWTIYTFDLLDKADRAKEELRELQTRINNTESSSIEISTREVNESGSILIIEVSLKNNGKSKLIYDLSTDALKVYKVAVKGDAILSTKLYKPKFYSKIAVINTGERNGYQEEMIVLNGSTKVLSYAVKVDEPGLYYITFRSDDKGSVSSLADSEVKAEWFAAKYVEVKGSER